VTQCIRVRTTGVPSQSVVYTNPGAPSAAHPSRTARSYRAAAAARRSTASAGVSGPVPA
jgi:hypothetical protein